MKIESILKPLTFLEVMNMFRYKLVKEITDNENTKQNMDSEWDILGQYIPSKKLIKIYDGSINKFLEREHPNIDKKNAFFKVQLLIRCHEHSHAFCHLASIKINKKRERWKNYDKATPEILEPLAEIITCYFCEYLSNKLGDNEYIELFKLIDKNSPPLYKRWNEIDTVIKEILKSKGFDNSITLKYASISLILKSLINEDLDYNSFDNFLGDVNNKKDEIFEELKKINQDCVLDRLGGK